MSYLDIFHLELIGMVNHLKSALLVATPDKAASDQNPTKFSIADGFTIGKNLSDIEFRILDLKNLYLSLHCSAQ